MSDYTPGPWEVSYLDDTERPGIEADRFSVVIFGVRAEDDCGIHGRTEKEEMANARLIAAAPELLQALEQSLEEYKECGAISNETWKNADQAIAKAKGATP